MALELGGAGGHDDAVGHGGAPQSTGGLPSHGGRGPISDASERDPSGWKGLGVRSRSAAVLQRAALSHLSNMQSPLRRRFDGNDSDAGGGLAMCEVFTTALFRGM